MITPKMIRVVKAVVVAAATRGGELTMDELVALEGKHASKQAMQSTVRTLERRGMIVRAYETRSGKVRVYFLPTLRGVELARHHA